MQGAEWWFGRNTKGEEGERLRLGARVRLGSETRKESKVRGGFPCFLLVCLFPVVWFVVWWVGGLLGCLVGRSVVLLVT